MTISMSNAARLVLAVAGVLAPAAIVSAADAPPAPPPATSPADTPEVRDVRAAARAFAETLDAPDPAKTRALWAGTDEDFKTVEATRAAMAAVAKFNAAAAKRFPELAGRHGNDMTVRGLVAMIDRQPVRIDADVASFGDGVTLRKTAGQWRVVDLIGNPVLKPTMAGRLAAVTRVVGQTTPEIEAGKYTTMQELQQAVQGRMAAEMQAIRPPMPGTTTKPATSPSR